MSKNYFDKMDMVGHPINFKSYGSSTLKSMPGALLSLLFYIFMVYYFIDEIIKYIRKPYTTDYQLRSVHYPQINFKDYPHFVIMNCLIDSQNNSRTNLKEVKELLDESLTLQMVTRIPRFHRMNVALEISQCKMEMFLHGTIKNKVYNKFFKYCNCAPSSSLQNANMSFFFADTYHTHLNYHIKIKKEIFANKTRLKEAHEILIKNPPRSLFFFMDTSTEVENIEHPFTHFMNSHLNYLNPDFTAYSDIWFRQIQLVIDNNYLYPCNDFYIIL